MTSFTKSHDRLSRTLPEQPGPVMFFEHLEQGFRVLGFVILCISGLRASGIKRLRLRESAQVTLRPVW